MGVQRCSKGTQPHLLREEFNLIHISVGDIFIRNIKNHTRLEASVSRIVNSGQLVGDDIIEEIVQHRLQEHDCNLGCS